MNRINSLSVNAQVLAGKITGYPTLKTFWENVAKAFTDKRILITVSERKPYKTNSQNSYYWGVVLPIIQAGIIDTGERMTADKVHELLKYRHGVNDQIPDPETGEVLHVAKSLSTYTKEEMSEYIDACIHWAFDILNVQVPAPGEIEKLTFKI